MNIETGRGGVYEMKGLVVLSKSMPERVVFLQVLFIIFLDT